MSESLYVAIICGNHVLSVYEQAHYEILRSEDTETSDGSDFWQVRIWTEL